MNGLKSAIGSALFGKKKPKKTTSSNTKSTLKVQNSKGMQPSRYTEDDYTPSQAAQPNSYNNNQVTLNGGLLQNSDRKLRLR